MKYDVLCVCFFVVVLLSSALMYKYTISIYLVWALCAVCC